MEFTEDLDFNSVVGELQVARQTCDTLVEVFGFTMSRAREAVDAISDKRDVELAWNWLLDHGAEDPGGPVVPTQMCCHVHELQDLSPGCMQAAMAGNACVEGCPSIQNWLCLTCGESRCSRYNSSHNIAHYRNTGHCLALSLSDLSVWCYGCNKYVKSLKLEATLALAAWHKHHEEPPLESERGAGAAPTGRTAVSSGGAAAARHAPPPGSGGPLALECPQRTQRAIDILSERNILSK
jgi:hypothetical protein